MGLFLSHLPLSTNQNDSINKLLHVSNELNKTIEITLDTCEDISNELSSQVVTENDIKDNVLNLSSIALELKNKVKQM